MKNARNRIVLVAVLALASIFAGCTVEEGEMPPRKMEGEYAVFNAVCGLNHWAASSGVYTAFGFNEYLRQTTDTGREQICVRFFDWARVTSGGDGRWSLGNSSCRFDFVSDNAALLGEEGASWKVYYWDTKSPDSELLGEFTTEGDRVRCRIYKSFAGGTQAVDWLIRAAITPDAFRVDVEGSGRLEFANEVYSSAKQWRVEYRTLEPMSLNLLPETMSKGRFSVTATLSGDRPREMAFEALCIGPEYLKITAGDVSEEW